MTLSIKSTWMMPEEWHLRLTFDPRMHSQRGGSNMLWLTACCMRQCPASLSTSPRHCGLLHSGCSLALPWTFPSLQKAEVLSVLHVGVTVVSLCLKAVPLARASAVAWSWALSSSDAPLRPGSVGRITSLPVYLYHSSKRALNDPGGEGNRRPRRQVV